jgi:acyl carrier protein
MSDEAGLTRRVKRVIIEALHLNVDPDEIPDDETIFGGGLGADSTAALEVLFAVEEEFGIEVEDEDLRVEMFDSVRALRDYVLRKQGEASEEG